MNTGTVRTNLAVSSEEINAPQNGTAFFKNAVLFFTLRECTLRALPTLSVMYATCIEHPRRIDGNVRYVY